jgi:outer membrane lipoprotein SlyB
VVTFHPLPIFAAVAVVLLCCAGIAVYVGWIPTSGGPSGSAVPSKIDQALAPVLCGRCGVIEGVRENTLNLSSRGSVTGAALGQQLVGFSRDLTNMVGRLLVALDGRAARQATGPVTVLEITVRFDDGSSRVLTEVNPRARQPGERVKVVNGRIAPAPETASEALAKASR